MTKQGFAMLQDVIMDDSFPDLDLALRRGRHIDRDDADWYALLSDAQEQLELYYRRYGCELIHKTDGYFYLLPTGDKLSRRQLASTDMLVGQALALLYLDPATIERGGLVTQEELVAQLSSVLGSDALIGAFNPKRGKRYDERIAQKNVRSRVSESVRRLASLGFIQAVEEDRLRLRPALLRFAEPVRAASEPSEALAKLVARGEVALVPEEGTGESGESSDDAFETPEAFDSGDVDSDEATEAQASWSEAPPARAEQAAAHGGGRTPESPGAPIPTQTVADTARGEQLVLGARVPSTLETKSTSAPAEAVAQPQPQPLPLPSVSEAAPPAPSASAEAEEVVRQPPDASEPAEALAPSTPAEQAALPPAAASESEAALAPATAPSAPARIAPTPPLAKVDDDRDLDWDDVLPSDPDTDADSDPEDEA